MALAVVEVNGLPGIGVPLTVISVTFLPGLGIVNFTSYSPGLVKNLIKISEESTLFR